jgi:hypothetical protein
MTRRRRVYVVNKERNEAIIGLFALGRTKHEIAAELGLTPTVVVGVLQTARQQAQRQSERAKSRRAEVRALPEPL